MIRVRQHGDNKQLYDIVAFLPLLEERLHIDQWEIEVEWCTGDDSALIEKSANVPWIGAHHEFKDLYKGIFQTIDGEFRITAKEGTVRIIADDSSFWEIESTIPGLEAEFMQLYGAYAGPLAKQSGAPNAYGVGDL